MMKRDFEEWESLLFWKTQRLSIMLLGKVVGRTKRVLMRMVRVCRRNKLEITPLMPMVLMSSKIQKRKRQVSRIGNAIWF